jgi:DNA-binding response OmpR family regulator
MSANEQKGEVAMRGTPERNLPRPTDRRSQMLCPECGHSFMPDPSVHTLGPLTVGLGVGLTFHGEYIHLPPRELTMMAHLVRSHPCSCSRENLLNACSIYGDPHIVSVMIYALRRKLRGKIIINGRFLGWRHEGMHYGLELVQ